MNKFNNPKTNRQYLKNKKIKKTRNFGSNCQTNNKFPSLTNVRSKTLYIKQQLAQQTNQKLLRIDSWYSQKYVITTAVTLKLIKKLVQKYQNTFGNLKTSTSTLKQTFKRFIVKNLPFVIKLYFSFRRFCVLAVYVFVVLNCCSYQLFFLH